MKKLSVSFIFAMISVVSYGQFTKGTFMLGGNFGATFNAEKTKNGNTTTVTSHTNTVNMAPTAGYFIMDNLAVGAAVVMYTSKNKSSNGNNSTTSTSASLAPFARYYYHKFYGQGSFQVGSGKTRFVNNGQSSESTYGTTGWSLAAGYAHLLNQYIAVEPQVGYGSVGQRFSSTNKLIDSGLFIKIGFQIYFKK
jgi:outer membrane protein